ncbi:unnamed protein product, partial [Porites evermanni]
DCAPSTTFYTIVKDEVAYDLKSFRQSGFICHPCPYSHYLNSMCWNCTFCKDGLKSLDDSCKACPAGGFYQDQMGQITCKYCSIGTYVSIERHPGKRASDCWACPYGTLSNESAVYRACRCFEGFYRLDRFGPCSECPAHGINCVNDTAILAPHYYWKWTNQSNSFFYKNFVQNIHEAGYNQNYSRFIMPLPKPVKCPYAGSCKGRIDSDCNKGYQGNLCAICRSGYYLRFNRCIKCPSLAVASVSSFVVVALFVIVFLMIFWGNSKQTDNNRTLTDVIMSCFKIVIGFYQVISGIFTALVRVKWPVALIPMGQFLKVFEGNIFQFAPISCINSQLRLNAYLKFILVLSVNFFVVSIILAYIFLKKRRLNKRKDWSNGEKLCEVSCLKKSCYRNIFLFLLASYPVTSKTIIQIIPLPGACVTHCFTDHKNQCISLLKADYSLQCFTAQHTIFWPVAAVFSVYPVGFPILMLFLIYKYQKSQRNEELAFGLKVFFENIRTNFGNDSLIINILFVVLNSSIILVALGNICF